MRHVVLSYLYPRTCYILEPMNVYQALKNLRTGRYDYTCTNRDGSYPLGYCRAYKFWVPEDFTFYSPEVQDTEAAKLNKLYGPFKDNFHTDGHATEAEAVACYRKFLLDTQLRFSEKPAEDAQHKCAVCGAWTQHAGWIAGEAHHFWHLCLAHQSREAVETVFEGVSKAWGS